MKAAASRIATFGVDEIDVLLRTGSCSIEIEGDVISLSLDDVEIVSEEVGGWSVAQQDRITVALDVEITPALKKQGYARELVNRIQQMRKGLDLELTERISLEITGSPDFQDAVESHRQYVLSEVLGAYLLFSVSAQGETVETFEIGEGEVIIGLTRSGATLQKDAGVVNV